MLIAVFGGRKVELSAIALTFATNLFNTCSILLSHAKVCQNCYCSASADKQIRKSYDTFKYFQGIRYGQLFQLPRCYSCPQHWTNQQKLAESRRGAQIKEFFQ
ncbi:hypothetical protein EDC96DRAFT_515310 [Choanephora cucurbitarum]|nr:hypothetical protein EDC96DRAFT_515310 [Choanephora cucurbitarum]